MSCEYCNTTENRYVLEDVYLATISKGKETKRVITSHNSAAYFPINFCLHCGEPLIQPEPLSLEQLKQMDVEPLKYWAWIENLKNRMILAICEITRIGRMVCTLVVGGRGYPIHSSMKITAKHGLPILKNQNRRNPNEYILF